MLFLFFSLYLSCQAATLDGRWITDGQLGVYTITTRKSLYLVENHLWRRSNWKTGTLTFTTNTSLSITLDNGQIYQGEIWPATTATHIVWNNGTSWHKFASDVTCFRATKKRVQLPELSLPQDTLETIAPNTEITKVHVIIMTHFDLGYTDFAWCTVSQYFWQIYPGVIETSLADPTFKYTTHPWLLYFHINCNRLQKYIINVPELDFVCPTPEMISALEKMIQRGQLHWHSFAFDGFNELLGETLFANGFNYADWLSEKYRVPKVKTMSNIDIPGIYRAQVPTILKKNTKALYIGQNFFNGWAGAVLQLPNLFRWQNPANPDDFLVVMTHKLAYGGITPFDAVVDPVSGEALVVQCVLENSPPYTPVDVKGYINKIQRYFPNAQVFPSSFDAFVNQLLPHSSALANVSQDIGDTWVRAIGSDPVKTSTFLEGRRDFEECVKSGRCPDKAERTMDEALFLMTAPEHNWGLPCQTNNWEPAALSNQEKRDFIKSARRIRPSENKQTKTEPKPDSEEAKCGSVKFDSDGAISVLRWDGVDYANEENRIGLVLYTEHALQGFPGYEQTGWGDPVAKFLSFNSTPSLKKLGGDGCTVFEATTDLNQNDTEYGNMELVHTIRFFENNNSATLSVEFKNKALSYNMYASWADKINYGNAVSIQFKPFDPKQRPPTWTVTSLGVEYSPSDFAPNGTSHYHVADKTKFLDILSVRPLDSPLLMFGNNSASWFTHWDSPPDYNAGAWFNVFNQWNANWVVAWPWQKETITTRFQINF